MVANWGKRSRCEIGWNQSVPVAWDCTILLYTTSYITISTQQLEYFQVKTKCFPQLKHPSTPYPEKQQFICYTDPGSETSCNTEPNQSIMRLYICKKEKKEKQDPPPYTGAYIALHPISLTHQVPWISTVKSKPLTNKNEKKKKGKKKGRGRRGKVKTKYLHQERILYRPFVCQIRCIYRKYEYPSLRAPLHQFPPQYTQIRTSPSPTFLPTSLPPPPRFHTSKTAILALNPSTSEILRTA